jgi:hypothetical protein
MERHERLDAIGQQLIDQSMVEVEPLRISQCPCLAETRGATRSENDRLSPRTLSSTARPPCNDGSDHRQHPRWTCPRSFPACARMCPRSMGRGRPRGRRLRSDTPRWRCPTEIPSEIVARLLNGRAPRSELGFQQLRQRARPKLRRLLHRHLQKITASALLFRHDDLHSAHGDYLDSAACLSTARSIRSSRDFQLKDIFRVINERTRAPVIDPVAKVIDVPSKRL